jgi:Mg-chelatase subunit ChlD
MPIDNDEIDEFPNEWRCPITRELMIDPVIGPDGQTYERRAIEEWLKINTTSPVTRERMTSTTLIPNIALRNTIEKYAPSDELQEINKRINDAINNINGNDSNNDIVIDDKSHLNDEINLKLFRKEDLDGDVHFQLSLIPPENGQRKGSVFICVIDVSGSMHTSVSQNNIETDGFSRLDLVKHSMNTIIHVLNANDYLALIPFNNTAIILADGIQMNKQGKEKALKLIENLKPEGGTNIFDGLRLADEISQKKICQDKNVACLLLTDGVPNVSPPRGIIPMLERMFKEYLDGPNMVIHTFGYGYDLDSPLLIEISELTCGTYSYIPDATMVGTIFVNFLANVLATVAKNCSLNMRMLDTNRVERIYAFNKHVYTDVENPKDFSIRLGPVQYGQRRDLIIQAKSDSGKPRIKFFLKYNLGKVIKESAVGIDDLEPIDDISFAEQLCRVRTIEQITKGMIANETKDRETAIERINKLDKFVKAQDCFAKSDFMKSLAKDIKADDDAPNDGQILKVNSSNSG